MDHNDDLVRWGHERENPFAPYLSNNQVFPMKLIGFNTRFFLFPYLYMLLGHISYEETLVMRPPYTFYARGHFDQGFS